MKIFKSDKAQNDLLQIYAYLSERNPQAADTLIEEIDVRFKNLCRFLTAHVRAAR